MSSPPEPPFNTIAIVGLGLIGGSIALAVREAWPGARVIAVDSPSVLAHAAGSGAVDRVAEDVRSLRDPDLVVLAAPVCENIQLLSQIAGLPGPVVVTDVGGTKQQILAGARTLPPSVSFVGGHPLGGAERGGFAFARADLFAGRPWIFTPDTQTSADALNKLWAFVAGFGAKPTNVDAADHDRLMAFLSHLPQLTASALMEVAGSAATTAGLALAGQGLVDTTRLASSPSRMWRDICLTNAEAIGTALDLLIARLTAIRAGLSQGDAIDDMFEAASRWRGELMKGRE